MAFPKLLLFDLGGVLLDYTGTRDFLTLLKEPLTPEQIHEKWLGTDVWLQFELGRVGQQEFAETVARDWALTCTAPEFLVHFESWARALFPGASKLLLDLKPRYRLAALSNSNVTHWRRVEEILGEESVFERAFSSHQLGLRKPDRAIYEQSLQALGASPEETVFFDDLLENVEAARAVGMAAHQVRGVDELRACIVEQGLL
ncbi:MAG TPA: HAD family phosphatase [Dehalococcoidia bacterium]|nr:HAD family phosphatase [Dehalococcoidia bacterium]